MNSLIFDVPSQISDHNDRSVKLISLSFGQNLALNSQKCTFVIIRNLYFYI